MSGILGFTECPTATYPCRLCSASKEQVQTMISENISIVREPQQYDADVALANVSETGVKELFVFNQVSSFHVTQDCAIDIMHDGPEGVCHYVLIPVLKHCIDAGFFDIDTLNSRLALFDFGPCDKDYKPPCIPDDFYSNKKLKFTASEMNKFVRLLRVLVGDLVPSNDEFWELYKLTRQIMQIFQAKALPVAITEELDTLIDTLIP